MTTPTTPPRGRPARAVAIAALALATTAPSPPTTFAAPPAGSASPAAPAPAASVPPELAAVASDFTRTYDNACFDLRSTSELVLDERSTGALHALDVRRGDGGSGIRVIDRAAPFLRLIQAFDPSITVAQLDEVLRNDADQLATSLGGTLAGDPPGTTVTRVIAGVERTGVSRPLTLEGFEDGAIEVFTWGEPAPGEDGERATGLILRTTPGREGLQAEADAMLAVLEVGLIRPGDTVRTLIAGVPIGLPAVYRIVSADPVEAEQVGGIDANLDTLAGRISLRVLQTPLASAAEQLSLRFLDDYRSMMERDRENADGRRLSRGRTFVVVDDGHRPIEFERLVLGDNTLVSYRGARTEDRAMIGYGMLTTDQATDAAAAFVAGLAAASADAPSGDRAMLAATAWWQGVPMTMPAALDPATGPSGEGGGSELWSLPADKDGLADRLRETLEARGLVLRQVVGAPGADDPLPGAEAELAERVADVLGLTPAAEPTIRSQPVAVGEGDARTVRVRIVGEAVAGASSPVVLSVRAADRADGRTVVLQAVTDVAATPFARGILADALVRDTGGTMPDRVELGPGTIALDPARDLLVVRPWRGDAPDVSLERDDTWLRFAEAVSAPPDAAVLPIREVAEQVLRSDPGFDPERLRPVTIAGREAVMHVAAEPSTFGGREVLGAWAVVTDEEGGVWSIRLEAHGDLATAEARARALLEAIEAP